jgi:hypothetical protein
MGVMTKKYDVSVSFYPKLAIFGKTVCYYLWISSENVKFFKTRKNSNTGLSQIRNMGLMTKKYGVSVSFCPKLVIFGKTVG